MKMKNVLLFLTGMAVTHMASANGFAGAPDVATPYPNGRYIDTHAYEVTDTNGNIVGYKAGFNVRDHTQTGNTANNKVVSLEKMAKMAGRWYVSSNIMHKDQNDVYVGRMYNMTGLYSWIPGMPDHSHLGRISFAQVGNQDVWFGEWADVPAGGGTPNNAGNNRTVFYSGVGKTTNLPTSGTATYTVKGINGHVDHNTEVLQGQLTANFGTKTLNGSLSRTGLNIAINNAAINTAAASFSGAAKANGSINGTTQGHFYGNQGAALAGIAKFNGNSQLDTAFGGTKQ